ncbi:probable RNA-directed DNA polymerase from transposon X-element [Trichonephila clavipes]|nr:probable RNA-directed DNA polymerase from transposon X-element [Trichonephila clavipes]
MIERNRARKVWQFTRDPSDKRVLNNIQNRLHRKIKAFQNKIWEDELRALDPDDGSLWEMSKELRKKKSPVYALNGQGGIAHTDSDKAEILRRQSQRHSLLDKANKGGSAAGRTPFPTLFNIYINDIPKTRQTTVCLYADDTAILTQSANKNCITHFLHRHLAELEDWYKKWKISINPEKTEAVFFSAGRGTHKPPPIYVQNHPVPWSNSVNYLGVTLDQHLSFKDHITKINNKFRALACLYYPYFTRNSPLTIKNRLLIYTSILRPVLLYASPVWGHATKTQINRLETSQNVLIRKLTNSPWETRLPPRSLTNFSSTDSTPSSVAASPLDERKATLRSLKPPASAATSLIRTVKERRTGSPVSPYPSRPALLTLAVGPNPLWRAGQ